MFMNPAVVQVYYKAEIISSVNKGLYLKARWHGAFVMSEPDRYLRNCYKNEGFAKLPYNHGQMIDIWRDRDD